ncbi:MAG TPA: hypothetical protein VM843_08360, partial [Flavisolibacter sp.]|nr:hypothetical protein [Flavisolibacter sp.]
PYTFQMETITNTPVLHATPRGPQEVKNDVLVPRTNDKVVRLLVSAPLVHPVDPSPAERKRVVDSAVVVRYQWKGKTYYASTAKVKTLAPLMHQ